MARSPLALAAFLLLLAGCASDARPAVDNSDGRATAGDDDALAGAGAAASGVASAPCPLSSERLHEFPGAFDRLREDARRGPLPPEPATVYAECPTGFRWATTEPSPEGLFFRLVVDVPEKVHCLSVLLANGKDASPGPLAVAVVRAEEGTGWAMGSASPAARVQVLGADSNELLWSGGSWAGATGVGFGAGTWELVYAAQGAEGWDNDLSGGWAAVLALTCSGPLGIASVEAARTVHLHSQATLVGVVGVGSFATGYATIKGSAAADLGGTFATVLVGAFPNQAWRLVVESPKGTSESLVTPTDDGEFHHRGPPGRYVATLDKVDTPVFNAWWILLAGADELGSLARFT